MIRLISFTLLLLCAGTVSAQVGFNNPTPDPSSILDLTANDKGLLIPRMTTAAREAMAVAISPATLPRALMVFDETISQFCFFDGTAWYTLNQWKQIPGTTGVSVTGTVTAPNYALNTNGNGPVPAGGIIMWSGAINAIPVGWVLCDGQSGTPDLRNRFIVGAGSTYGVGNNGGNNSINLTAGQIPHHTHSGTTNTTGDHSHLINGETMQKEGTSTQTVKVLDTGTDPNRGDYTEYTGNAGSHSHTVSTNTTNGGTAGQGAAVDIRPMYWALAYIMKLP